MSSLISKNHLNFKTIEEFIGALEEIEHDNAFLSGSFDKELIAKHLSKPAKPGLLSGYFFSAKDLISNTDLEVTGGSRFMEGYTPPFNASAYAALKQEGAFNVVQANSDEFGLGGSGIGSAYGPVPNPIDRTRIIGGSSSGSAYLIHRKLIDFSMTSDTGDSARYPASLVGIIGFKPSYGFVSRYGFFPFCSSLDTPSICAASMETLAKVFSVVSFPDPKDLCTLRTKKTDYLKIMEEGVKTQPRVAVLDDTFWSRDAIDTESYRRVKGSFEKLLERLESEKAIRVETVHFRNPLLLRLASLVYVVVAYSESVSNYANLTGLLFPLRWDQNGEVRVLKKDNGEDYEEILKRNRSVFGDEFTYRQLLGKYFVDGANYEDIYLKCKRVMGLINEEVKSIFKDFDLIISPTAFDIPEKIEDWRRGYSPRNDSNIRILANFCALPAISIPWETVEGMPVGLHIMADYGKDGRLLQVANDWLNWMEGKK